MFEYFTDRTIQVILLAQEEARRLGQRLVGSEQLLLGLVGEGNSHGARLLLEGGRGGLDLDAFRSRVEAMVGRGSGYVPPEIPFTPKAKQILERALTEARNNDQQYVTPEHLLLSLVRDRDNAAVKILQDLGFDPTQLRVDLLRHLGEQAIAAPAAGKGSNRAERPGQKRDRSSVLQEFGTDLTARAQSGQLDPVVGRSRETERVVQILGRRTKNNPILIGEPGVGKTAIAEGLAQRIALGDVPENLAKKRVISLDLGLLVAGTQYRGAFEERLTAIVEEVRDAGDIILFIDEVHTLLGAGSMQGGLTAANLLKPALARGELQCIGATTLDEFRQHIERDAALERRFQPVKVGEPTADEAVEILLGLRPTYEQFHKVKIADAALVAAVQLSERYISDRFLPDKAIDLIDEAGSRVHLNHAQLSPQIRQLKATLATVTAQKETAIDQENFDLAGQLRDRELALKKELQTLRQPAPGADCPQVGVEDIAQIVSTWTGVPVTKLSESEAALLMHLEDTLHERLIGQEEAVSAVARSLRRARSGLRDANRPIASFVFLGPTGVGKTELSKALASYLFGADDAMIRVDMSEFMESHTVSKLIGAPPGFVGYDDGGTLTEAIRRRPYSVVLFDEIEKAHPDVFNLLLQLLDEGRLTDSRGRVVSFKNALVIMTSNLGATAIAKGGGGLGFNVEADGDDAYRRMRDRVQEELKNFFRPEFLNRLDEIVVFRPLTQPEVRRIADLMVIQVAERLTERQLSLVVSDRVKERLAIEGYDPTLGARPLRRKVTELLEDVLAEGILAGRFHSGETITVDLDDDGQVTLESRSPLVVPVPAIAS
ncbi:MAG: ATP-dependent Clp protease ATP-binding subunit [Cyanophyceae cyanobacterium]